MSSALSAGRSALGEIECQISLLVECTALASAKVEIEDVVGTKETKNINEGVGPPIAADPTAKYQYPIDVCVQQLAEIVECHTLDHGFNNIIVWSSFFSRQSWRHCGYPKLLYKLRGLLVGYVVTSPRRHALSCQASLRAFFRRSHERITMFERAGYEHIAHIPLLNRSRLFAK